MMRIETRTLDVSREALVADTGRQVQYASEPQGGNTAPMRSDTVSVGSQSYSATPKTADVKETVEKLNKYVQSQQRHVNFSVDEATHSNVIRVYNTQTGELIRQFPPEEVLAMAAKIRQSIGWMIDSKA